MVRPQSFAMLQGFGARHSNPRPSAAAALGARRSPALGKKCDLPVKNGSRKVFDQPTGGGLRAVGGINYGRGEIYPGGGVGGPWGLPITRAVGRIRSVSLPRRNQKPPVWLGPRRFSDFGKNCPAIQSTGASSRPRWISHNPPRGTCWRRLGPRIPPRPNARSSSTTL